MSRTLENIVETGILKHLNSFKEENIMKKQRNAVWYGLILVYIASLALSGCGGGGGSTDNSNTGGTTYTIGGTVSGLTGAGLVLQNNAGDDKSITTSGSFTFTTGIANGGTYSVTVKTQPTGQTCTVASGSGTVAAANVTNVAVTCAASGGGTYDFMPKYTGTAKATMYYPLFDTLKVWEASADVTFEKDPAISVPGLDFLDFYNTSAGTVTMTIYTYPDPTGMCYGDPASFTDTYPIFRGDGTLTILRNSQPLQYRVYASMTSSTPVQVHNYKLCCSWRNPPCEDSSLSISKQLQEWLNSGDSDTTAQSDGTLQGTYHDGANYGPFYEWSLMPMN